jgi:hypothetical protein
VVREHRHHAVCVPCLRAAGAGARSANRDAGWNDTWLNEGFPDLVRPARLAVPRR